MILQFSVYDYLGLSLMQLEKEKQALFEFGMAKSWSMEQIKTR